MCDGTFIEGVEMLTNLLETIEIGFGKRWQLNFSVKDLKESKAVCKLNLLKY